MFSTYKQGMFRTSERAGRGRCLCPEAIAKALAARRGSPVAVEPAALAALLSAGGYGYDLRRTIMERTDGEVDVDVGGLYRSLRRLEEEGAVVSRWCDDETGPRRREYQVTEQGIELAEQWLDALRQRQHLDELLVGLLEGGLHDMGREG